MSTRSASFVTAPSAASIPLSSMPVRIRSQIRRIECGSISQASTENYDAASIVYSAATDMYTIKIEVVVGSSDVSLEISDNILFAPASAALSAMGIGLLDELAALLQTLPYSLSVEGHSDNVPIQTVRYPSNWELSSARAAAVTRALIEKGIAPERIRAIGYGDTRPRDDNGSAAGRARNRRVSFVLQLAGEV